MLAGIEVKRPNPRMPVEAAGGLIILVGVPNPDDSSLDGEIIECCYF
jgi:hypothetical protein